MTFSADLLRERLDYDPTTGEFRYRYDASNGRVRAGDIAGGLSAAGYRIINIGGARRKAHRLAILWVTGEWPEGEVDHLNGRRSDNRYANLRDGTKSDNQQNVLAPRSDNRCGYRGVHKLGGRSKRWIARAWMDGKRIAIGHFDTAEEAGAAYRKFKIQQLANRGVSHAD